MTTTTKEFKLCSRCLETLKADGTCPLGCKQHGEKVTAAWKGNECTKVKVSK